MISTPGTGESENEDVEHGTGGRGPSGGDKSSSGNSLGGRGGGNDAWGREPAVKSHGCMAAAKAMKLVRPARTQRIPHVLKTMGFRIDCVHPVERERILTKISGVSRCASLECDHQASSRVGDAWSFVECCAEAYIVSMNLQGDRYLRSS